MTMFEYACYRVLRQRTKEAELPALQELARRADEGDREAAAQLRGLMAAALATRPPKASRV
jgi:hypothetical protein